MCNIHGLFAGTSAPLSGYAGLSVVAWMSCETKINWFMFSQSGASRMHQPARLHLY